MKHRRNGEASDRVRPQQGLELPPRPQTQDPELSVTAHEVHSLDSRVRPPTQPVQTRRGVEVTEPDLPSNWGRWGAEDQLGTLNLIDADARLRAAAEVRTGRHVSLARPVAPVPFTAAGGPVGKPTRMPAAVLQTIGFGGTDPFAMTDTLIVNTHNAALTHLDAVAHIPIDQQIYPGVPLDDAVTPLGVRHGSADNFAAGIITRGILLDLAPDDVPLKPEHRISSADLDRILDKSGVHLQLGDAIAVRAGWDVNRPMHEPVPGLDLSAIAWLHAHDVSVYIGDVGDPRPPTFPLPLHQVALARLGLPLVDAAALDDLATTCRAEQRCSFLLVLAPPPITGTTGLPVNPIAIF
jgi:kynurenine formamidase